MELSIADLLMTCPDCQGSGQNTNKGPFEGDKCQRCGGKKKAPTKTGEALKEFLTFYGVSFFG